MYKNATLPAELSFFSTDKDNMVISTVKRAEDNNGFVVRVFENTGKETNAKIRLFKPISSGMHTNLLEFPLQKIMTLQNEAEIFVGHYGIETFLLTK